MVYVEEVDGDEAGPPHDGDAAGIHAALAEARSTLENSLNSGGGGVEALLRALAGLQSALGAASEGEGVISEEDRRLADAHFNLGDALANQEGDFEGATAEFCKALAANP